MEYESDLRIYGSSGRTLILNDDKDNGTVEFSIEYLSSRDRTDIDKELIPAIIDFLQKCL